MSSVFAALGNIQCDVEHHTASFTFADVKMRMVEDLIFVDETLLSWEKYNQALDQLDAVAQILEQNKYQLDKGLMSVVNQDNQLGRLLGVYIPQEFRFEMVEPTTSATGDATQNAGTGNKEATGTQNNATDTSKEGNSVADKAKELAKKMWEMLKAFFEKIAQGLKSFWQWLMNGFQTNKASNEKLLEAIKADEKNGYAKLNKALQEAQGFIDASQANGNSTKATEIAGKITKSPLIVAMDNSDCSKVMTDLNNLGIWNKSISEIFNGVDEASFKDIFMKVTPAGEGGLLPTIAVDKELIASLKKNKASMSTKGWTPQTVIDCIVTCNTWYENSKAIRIPKFIEAAGRYDWENSSYVKDGKVEPKLAKRQCQAVCKFYTQFCKLLVALVDVLQSHINAIKKPFNVAVGQPQAAPQVNTSDVKGAPGPQTGQNSTATTANQGQQIQSGNNQ